MVVVNDDLRRGMRAIIDERDPILTRTVADCKSSPSNSSSSEQHCTTTDSEFVILQCDFTIFVVALTKSGWWVVMGEGNPTRVNMVIARPNPGQGPGQEFVGGW